MQKKGNRKAQPQNIKPTQTKIKTGKSTKQNFNNIEDYTKPAKEKKRPKANSTDTDQHHWATRNSPNVWETTQLTKIPNQKQNNLKSGTTEKNMYMHKNE